MLQIKNSVQLNVEVQWNNIKKYVLDAMSDWIGKVDIRARKPWIREGQGNGRTKEVEEC